MGSFFHGCDYEEAAMKSHFMSWINLCLLNLYQAEDKLLTENELRHIRVRIAKLRTAMWTLKQNSKGADWHVTE